MFVLPKLPYALDALVPHMSRETLDTHYNKHHAAYVEKTNALMKEDNISDTELEEVIIAAYAAGNAKLFNQAAQAWNHAFFWNSMSPKPAAAPAQALTEAINKAFGNYDDFRAAALEKGVAQFGSGWLWLVSDARGAVSLKTTHDADNPLINPGEHALLTCDLWEHAYYLDHKNERKKFLEGFFGNLVDWRFADGQYASATGRGAGWRYPEAQRSAA
ncbi:MAG: superoxide dismutase [Caulobacterales bacterium]